MMTSRIFMWVGLLVFNLDIASFSSVNHVYAGDRLLSLEQIFNSREFAIQGFNNAKWTPDGQYLVYVSKNTAGQPELHRYHVSTKTRSAWITADKLEGDAGKKISIEYYEISSDGQQVLFTGLLPARSEKSGGWAYIYDVKAQTIVKVLEDSKNAHGLQNIHFSPDGKKLGYVLGNNLFVYDVATRTPKQLTHDGSENRINATFDWAYEEEFQIIRSWEWSPDSEFIAFWQIDQEQVPTFPMIDHAALHSDVTRMRYPKAGDPNPVAKIGIVHIGTESLKWVNFNDQEEAYIPRIKWLASSKYLTVQRLNRKQDRIQLYNVNPLTGEAAQFYHEHEDTWIEVNPDSILIDDGQKMIWSSEIDEYRHIYVFDFKNNTQRQLTSGNWEVKEILGFNEKTQDIFFLANKDSNYEDQLYSIKLSGGQVTRMTNVSGSHSVEFSPSYEYYLDTYSEVNEPTNYRICTTSTNVCEIPQEVVRPKLEQYALASISFEKFNTTEGLDFNAVVMKPADFDPAKSYPVLIQVYGGPGSQIATNSWKGQIGLWHHYLTQKGYVVVLVDHRGTGGRGKKFKSVVYRNLGNYESQDVLATVKYLGSQNWVQKNRIGIWGWSYGAYLSALSMCKAGDLLRTCVSVAPVTNWRFYDSIYTERYMGTPEDNPQGYLESSVMTHASGLQGKFLLVAGYADDNVHIQNSINLAAALDKLGKQYREKFYRDQDHGLVQVRYHLFTMMTDFILQNL